MPYRKDEFFYFVGDFRQATVVIQSDNVAVPAEKFQDPRLVILSHASESGNRFMVFIRPDCPEERALYARKKNAAVFPQDLGNAFVFVDFGFYSYEMQNDELPTQPNGRGFESTAYGRYYDDKQDPNSFKLEF